MSNSKSLLFVIFYGKQKNEAVLQAPFNLFGNVYIIILHKITDIGCGVRGNYLFLIIYDLPLSVLVKQAVASGDKLGFRISDGAAHAVFFKERHVAGLAAGYRRNVYERRAYYRRFRRG